MNLLCERDASGTVIAGYTHGYAPVDGIGSGVGQKLVQGGATYHEYDVGRDTRGSVYRRVDSNGNVTGYFEYNAFGVPLREEEIGAHTRFRYQPNWIKLKDSPFPLYLSSTRLEAPEWGRFLGRDARGSLDGGYIYLRDRLPDHVDANGLGTSAINNGGASGGQKPPPKPAPPEKPEPFKPRPRDREKYPEVYDPTESPWQLMPPRWIPDEWKENAKKNGGFWPLTSDEYEKWRKKMEPIWGAPKAEPKVKTITDRCKCWKWLRIGYLTKDGFTRIPNGATISPKCGSLIAEVQWVGQGNDDCVDSIPDPAKAGATKEVAERHFLLVQFNRPAPLGPIPVHLKPFSGVEGKLEAEGPYKGLLDKYGMLPRSFTNPSKSGATADIAAHYKANVERQLGFLKSEKGQWSVDLHMGTVPGLNKCGGLTRTFTIK